MSFAANTTVICIIKTSNLLVQKGNKELQNIDNWLIASKLSPNIKKQNKYYLAHLAQKEHNKNNFRPSEKN